MNKGPNQPQQPGNRRRRRRRGSSGKKQGGQPNTVNMNAPSHPGGRPQRHHNNNRNRRPATFVGPMDHSYRNGVNQNGNIADGEAGARLRQQLGRTFVPPPENPAAVEARKDGPARIFCFIDDLFFLAKINETARKLSVKVEFVKTPDLILERAQDSVPETERPALVIFDLNNLNAKPLTVIPKLRSKLQKATSIIGFVSHVQGELKMKALEAGCDVVMPRSAFSQNLPNLLRRHGAPDDMHQLAD
jgi:CheY-like chemotaxis protein